jgi:hypothetical protein
MENEYRADAGLGRILGNVWADLRPCRPTYVASLADVHSAGDGDPAPFAQAARNSLREWPATERAARAE